VHKKQNNCIMAERNQSKALEAQRLRRAAELERRTKRQLGAIISAIFRVFFFISFYGSPLFLVCCLTWFVRCFCLWVKERAFRYSIHRMQHRFLGFQIAIRCGEWSIKNAVGTQWFECYGIKIVYLLSNRFDLN